MNNKILPNVSMFMCMFKCVRITCRYLPCHTWHQVTPHSALNPAGKRDFLEYSCTVVWAGNSGYHYRSRIEQKKLQFMKFLLASLFLFMSLPSLAQTSSVSYHCELKLNIDHGENGLNKLYFSGGEGLYVYKDWPEQSRQKIEGNVISYIKPDNEGMPIYTNLAVQHQIYKHRYLDHKGPWIFTEPLPTIDWTITQQKKAFGTLNAFLATGTYGGRDYEVWFTPDIPVPLGPHRLNGLPGIILEAKSTDGLVSFTFLGYQPIDADSVIVAPPTEGIKISRRDFDKYCIQYLLKTEANSPPEWNDTIDDPHANYEIEKNKWTIFSEYKKKRKLKNGGW